MSYGVIIRSPFVGWGTYPIFQNKRHNTSILLAHLWPTRHKYLDSTYVYGMEVPANYNVGTMYCKRPRSPRRARAGKSQMRGGPVLIAVVAFPRDLTLRGSIACCGAFSVLSAVLLFMLIFCQPPTQIVDPKIIRCFQSGIIICISLLSDFFYIIEENVFDFRL